MFISLVYTILDLQPISRHTCSRRRCFEPGFHFCRNCRELHINVIDAIKYQHIDLGTVIMIDLNTAH